MITLRTIKTWKAKRDKLKDTRYKIRSKKYDKRQAG